MFYFNMKPRLKLNETVLASEIIVYHFRREDWNEMKLF